MICICLALGMVSMLGACSDGAQEENAGPAVSPNARASNDNARLPDSQIDTLRVMRIRYNVTRDEYWSDYGGVLGNAYFDVWYPTGNTSVTHGMAALRQLEMARTQGVPLFGTGPQPKLTVVCSRSLKWYEKNTGQTWWHYSRLTDEQMTIQPMMMLYQRGLIDIAIKREYFRWIARIRSRGRAPLWIQNGFAAVLAKEQEIVTEQMGEFGDARIAIDLDQIESDLAANTDKKASRIANYNAFRMVERIVATHGEQSVGDLIVGIGVDSDIDQSCQRAFGMSYDALVRAGMQWKQEAGQ